MRDGDGDPALDRQDMERLGAGHAPALDALIHRHGARLHAYALRLLQNDADADDLVQETFVRVYEARARFDPRHRFTTWLYTIATNLVRDRYRWRSRHPEVALDAQGPDEDRPPPAASLPDPGHDPHRHAVTVERAQAVRAAVAGLPEDLREPLLLAEYEGQSHLEIAEILGCSAKAVEMRLYRARQTLRETLARWLA